MKWKMKVLSAFCAVILSFHVGLSFSTAPEELPPVCLGNLATRTSSLGGAGESGYCTPQGFIEIEFKLRFGCDVPMYLDQGIRFEVGMKINLKRVWLPIRFYANNLQEFSIISTVHLLSNKSIHVMAETYNTTLSLLLINSTETVTIREYLCNHDILNNIRNNASDIRLRWVQRSGFQVGRNNATWYLDDINVRRWNGKCFVRVLSEDFSVPRSPPRIQVEAGNITNRPSCGEINEDDESNSVLYFNLVNERPLTYIIRSIRVAVPRDFSESCEDPANLTSIQGGVDDSCQIKPNSTSRPQSVTLQCSLADVECSCGEQRRLTTGVACGEPIQSQTTPSPNTMIECRTDRSCGGSSVTSTVKDCCDHDIEPSGFAYTIPGVGGCQLCPVDFGFSQSSFSGIERRESYMVQVKFFSGGITTGFFFDLYLDLSNCTTSSSDITLSTTQGRFLPSDVLQPKVVEFFANVRGSNETFVILLQLSSTDQFGGADITLRDRLEVVIIDSDVSGCPMETDSLWNIIWLNTPPDTTSIQRCPGGPESVGNATRYCDSNGVWSGTDVLSCMSAEFTTLEQELVQSLEVFSSNDSEVLLNQSAIVTSQLTEATTRQEPPLFPTELQTTNSIIHSVINILEDNADVLQQPSVRRPNVDDVLNIFNNVLDESNTAGWLSLQIVEPMSGSELLLSNIERYGLILAKEIEAPRRLSRPNIVLSASQFSVSSQVTEEDLRFPTGENLVNYTSRIIPIMATIPANLIIEKLNTSSSVPVVHILFNNLEDFLPLSLLDSSESPNKTSVIYSLQIGERKDQSRVLLEEPISLEFTFSTFEESSDYTCAFWDFSEPIGGGGFSTDGVTTANINRGKNITSVQCLSNHATSFAVLVDVAGGLETVSEGELKALQIVSYFGCSVSILCLSLTVLFFLTQRKKIFKSVNFFAHLNLAAVLLAAFIVFVFGIELGTTTTGGCLFVALLLHYLFLSAFCWMLCEGILLYLLLVVVFSRLSRQWWLSILIGYVIPVPIVVISVASRHDYYGVRSSEGILKYCWLSVEKGTIYAFVAPMLVIILINAVFLVLSLNSLLKSKKKRYSMKKADKKATFTRAKSLFIASIILLPLLGLTWTFGILTINSNSTVFAWLFTVFNSLQGAAIFFFHVVRNEKVWSKIQPRLSTLSSKILGTKEGDTKLHTSENSSWSTKYTNNSSKGYDMNTVTNGETALKVKPKDSTMSEEFNNPLVLEETKIDLPDNDKVKDEDIKVEEHEKQAKESADKEASIINHHKDVNPASEDTIIKEMTAHGSQEGVDEGDDEAVAKGSNIEAEVDNMSMEGSSTINPAVSDHKDVNLQCEDNETEGTKIKQLESQGESMDGNAESNGSSALH